MKSTATENNEMFIVESHYNTYYLTNLLCLSEQLQNTDKNRKYVPPYELCVSLGFYLLGGIGSPVVKNKPILTKTPQSPRNLIILSCRTCGSLCNITFYAYYKVWIKLQIVRQKRLLLASRFSSELFAQISLSSNEHAKSDL